MRPELQRLHDELTEARADLAAVEDATRTATNGWTVAQVLDHLAKAHAQAATRLDAALDAAPPRTDDDPVRYSLLDRQIVRTMAGESFKIPVPAIFEPSATAGPEAKPACLEATDALLAVLVKADGRRLSGLKVASPLSDRMRLGLLAYLDGVVQHARYHRGQI